MDDTAIYGTDYSSPSDTAVEPVTFAIGETSATVTYTIIADTDIEDMETFTLNLALSGTTDTDMFATIISPVSTTVCIMDCTGMGESSFIYIF